MIHIKSFVYLQALRQKLFTKGLFLDLFNVILLYPNMLYVCAQSLTLGLGSAQEIGLGLYVSFAEQCQRLSISDNISLTCYCLFFSLPL